MHVPKRKGKQEETVELTFIIFKPFFGGKGGTSGRPWQSVGYCNLQIIIIYNK